MTSQKALYDISAIKFIHKFSTLITSTNVLLALLLRFRACEETFLQGHKEMFSMNGIMQHIATSYSFIRYNTSHGAKVHVGFYK